ncbi:unnamed protein product [Haemonchus placei]|uniref:Fibrous sheath-interacting protein 1 n=1 Tax=Haemonchus placei TaxID=6290 RepID=A0A0N4WEZ9_HAEPC|nr:unnamed protein product [Haemonchus placei]
MASPEAEPQKEENHPSEHDLCEERMQRHLQDSDSPNKEFDETCPSFETFCPLSSSNSLTAIDNVSTVIDEGQLCKELQRR